MAIKDFFKSTPEPERERCLQDPEQILAWLEELSRTRTLMDLEFGDSEFTPIPGKTELVGEETRTCSFQLQRAPHREPTSGQKVRLLFPMDGQRFQTELVYQGRGGYLEYKFALPNAIRHAERRDSFRVHFRSRELFHIVALQSLFEGLGLSGDLVDLSMGGCRFTINRAIRIQDEKRVAIHPELLTPGTNLSLVRLPDLTHLPLVECGAHVSHMRPGPRGMTMGLAFEGLGSFENGILGRFLSERIPGFTLGFPRKRRFRDLSEEERKLPQPSQQAEEAEELPPGPDEGVPPLTDAEATELQNAIHEDDRLMKLRKRGKKILLVMGDELDRTLLMTMFHQDGFRCMFEASSLVQALEVNRRLPLDLLVVDQTVGPLGALQLVGALRDKGMPAKTPVVVIQRTVDVRLSLAARAGGVNLLVERPVDFTGAMKTPIEAMLGLQSP